MTNTLRRHKQRLFAGLGGGHRFLAQYSSASFSSLSMKRLGGSPCQRRLRSECSVSVADACPTSTPCWPRLNMSVLSGLSIIAISARRRDCARHHERTWLPWPVGRGVARRADHHKNDAYRPAVGHPRQRKPSGCVLYTRLSGEEQRRCERHVTEQNRQRARAPERPRHGPCSARSGEVALEVPH